jgi:hypothetical protein
MEPKLVVDLGPDAAAPKKTAHVRDDPHQHGDYVARRIRRIDTMTCSQFPVSASSRRQRVEADAPAVIASPLAGREEYGRLSSRMSRGLAGLEAPALCDLRLVDRETDLVWSG